MFGLLNSEKFYPQEEYSEMNYRGLLLDDRQPYSFRELNTYVPYDQSFMISPEELEMRRLQMQMDADSAVSREFTIDPYSKRIPMGFYDGRNYHTPQEYYFNPNRIYDY